MAMNWQRAKLESKMRRHGAQSVEHFTLPTVKSVARMAANLVRPSLPDSIGVHVKMKRAAQERDKRICQRAPVQQLTAEEIDARRSERGGWSRRQLAEWGVPWPPPKGWRLALLAGENPKCRTARNRLLKEHYLSRANRATVAACHAYQGPCPWQE